MRYLLSSIKQGGSFGGSTQATILCLKALLLYYDTRAELSAPAKFTLYINGKSVETLEITNGTSKVEFGVVKNEKVFGTKTIGGQSVELVMETDAEEFALSYLVEAEYLDSKPPSAPDAKIEFHLTYSDQIESLKVGEATT